MYGPSLHLPFLHCHHLLSCRSDPPVPLSCINPSHPRCFPTDLRCYTPPLSYTANNNLQVCSLHHLDVFSLYYLVQNRAHWFGFFMATGWLFLNPATALYQFTAANHSPNIHRASIMSSVSFTLAVHIFHDCTSCSSSIGTKYWVISIISISGKQWQQTSVFAVETFGQTARRNSSPQVTCLPYS